ncbi:RIP metalloprotease RseP [Alkalicella caledoniensis]|uniref:Zinc metalloprotease n=1 Tax=Alkalicella caledoniensis TaxID=2731377 RepID=A0A7G9WCP3_ALKCA|nr:RIP metalloprotease RseP [Alkalicella caledoniensis]QNO16455.1 RIP metalloprotease RseP [Alkalicella caledoniensis]
MTILIAIIVFGLLILVHELGHFLTAKAVGMKVEEFAIGFGPAIIKFKKGETLYGIRIFPLGGYVKVLGEEGKDVESEDSYQSKTVLQRFLFVFAGAFMNFVLAVVIFMIIFLAVGVPADIPEIGSVAEQGIADIAGFRKGDHVLEIDGEPVKTWTELVEQISTSPGEELDFRISRNGQIINLQVTPRFDDQTERGMIGIGSPTKTVALFEGVKASFRETLSVATLIVESLQMLFRGKASTSDIAGPVGIVVMVGESARHGLSSLLYLTALLSVNLGILNLLPVPALDGSRLVFLLIEAVRGKPIDPEKEGLVHIIGFGLLLLLMVFILYNDIINFIIP